MVNLATLQATKPTNDEQPLFSTCGKELTMTTTLSRLLQSPGAWRNSLIRKALPERLKEEMDGLGRAELREALRTMQDLSSRYDFDTALQAMEQATELGRLSSANSVVLAARLATFEPEETSPVDLGVYDELLQMTGGTAH